MSLEIRLSPHPLIQLHSCILRCERLEDRLAFSIGGVPSCLGIGEMIDLARKIDLIPVDSMLTSDEIPEASDLAIVEEQDTSQQSGDEVPPFGIDSAWENEDQWLAEDDQLVWYMPWFGDEDNGVGDILCDDAGTIVDVLPLMAEEEWDTYEVPNLPVFHPRGPFEDGIAPPILESLTSDWLSSMQDVTIEVTNFGIHGAGDIPIVATSVTRTASLLSSQTTMMNVPLSTSVVPQPAPMASLPWVAIAPESTYVHFYTPPTIQLPDHSEDEELQLVAEVV
jgi:hypothetical protein